MPNLLEGRFVTPGHAPEHDPRHAPGMKIVLSLPDELVSAADEQAARLGMSRNELYATAVAALLARHVEDEITANLDEIYAQEPSGLDPAVRRAQQRAVGPEQW